MKILETKKLKKYYGKGDTLVKALDGVDLAVEDGEFVAIVGTSGSGKSTLLHMLGGLDRPTNGTVIVDGKDIFSLKDEASPSSAAGRSASCSRALTWCRCSLCGRTLSCPSSWTAAK